MEDKEMLHEVYNTLHFKAFHSLHYFYFSIVLTLTINIKSM
mgnify:CR=1 FL=1